MGPKSILVFLSFVFFVSNVLSTSKGTLPYYDTTEKYTCIRKMDIFLDHGIIFKYNHNFLKTWPGNAEFRCHTSITSRTENAGVVAVIQKMNFRKKSDCLDYIHFGEGNTKKCGEIIFGTTMYRDGGLTPPPEFISSFRGPFMRVLPTYDVQGAGNQGYTTYTSERTGLLVAGAVVDPQKVSNFMTRVDPSKLSPGEKIEMEVAFTAYKDCEDFNNSEELFNCGYGVCILSIYVNDGVVNCPFGDCRDEGSCEEAFQALVMDDEGGAGNVTKSSNLHGIRSRSPTGNFTGVSHRSMHHKWEGAHTKYAQQTLDEVKNIGSAFEKHNIILEQMSDIFKSGVQILEGKMRPGVN